ncbi:unnamed protein product [Amoebophrya sp. A120]|nr:unnamed protein product [Amoebophrya sp. A120]|eukprot:GSA120T00020657001.1
MSGHNAQDRRPSGNAKKNPATSSASRTSMLPPRLLPPPRNKRLASSGSGQHAEDVVLETSTKKSLPAVSLAGPTKIAGSSSSSVVPPASKIFTENKTSTGAASARSAAAAVKEPQIQTTKPMSSTSKPKPPATEEWVQLLAQHHKIPATSQVLNKVRNKNLHLTTYSGAAGQKRGTKNGGIRNNPGGPAAAAAASVARARLASTGSTSTKTTFKAKGKGASKINTAQLKPAKKIGHRAARELKLFEIGERPEQKRSHGGRRNGRGKNVLNSAGSTCAATTSILGPAAEENVDMEEQLEGRSAQELPGINRDPEVDQVEIMQGKNIIEGKTTTSKRPPRRPPAQGSSTFAPTRLEQRLGIQIGRGATTTSTAPARRSTSSRKKTRRPRPDATNNPGARPRPNSVANYKNTQDSTSQAAALRVKLPDETEMPEAQHAPASSMRVDEATTPAPVLPDHHEILTVAQESCSRSPLPAGVFPPDQPALDLARALNYNLDRRKTEVLVPKQGKRKTKPLPEAKFGKFFVLADKWQQYFERNNNLTRATVLVGARVRVWENGDRVRKFRAWKKAGDLSRRINKHGGIFWGKKGVVGDFSLMYTEDDLVGLDAVDSSDEEVCCSRDGGAIKQGKINQSEVLAKQEEDAVVDDTRRGGIFGQEKIISEKKNVNVNRTSADVELSNKFLAPAQNYEYIEVEKKRLLKAARGTTGTTDQKILDVDKNGTTTSATGGASTTVAPAETTKNAEVLTDAKRETKKRKPPAGTISSSSPSILLSHGIIVKESAKTLEVVGCDDKIRKYIKALCIFELLWQSEEDDDGKTQILSTIKMENPSSPHRSEISDAGFCVHKSGLSCSRGLQAHNIMQMWRGFCLGT